VFIYLYVLCTCVLAISDINKVSNEILLSLHQSLSIIKTKKLNHDNMHNKTITSSQKLMKPHKNISQTVQLVSNINILITYIILIHLNGSLFILASHTNQFCIN